MTQNAVPARPEQLRLWPTDDDDALIYQSSAAYRRLDDTGQKIVRAYLVALDQTGDFPTRAKIATVSGLSRSTVSEHLAKGSAEMAAITEILAACRDDLARRSSIAIPALAALIMQQFFPSTGRLGRDTRSLTKVEYDILRTAAMMGGVAIGPDGQPASLTLATQMADGTAAVAKVEIPTTVTTPSVTLQDMLSKLRGEQRRQDDDGAELDVANCVRLVPSGTGDAVGSATAEGSDDQPGAADP